MIWSLEREASSDCHCEVLETATTYQHALEAGDSDFPGSGDFLTGLHLQSPSRICDLCFFQREFGELQYLKRKESQHFGRLRWADHLKSGVQDKPGQHAETLFLLKIQKLAGCDGVCL